MFVCELIFSFDSEWTKKIILPMPDNWQCLLDNLLKTQPNLLPKNIDEGLW